MNETIMIVDDSLFITEGLVAILKRKGYTTIPALSGVECLEILKTTIPDLILLDIMMEPIDGWETLGRLKANPATKGIPILMFSAKKISPSEAQEHSINIDDFVTKPVNPVQLLESIQRIFNRRNDVKAEVLVAQDAGLDRALIDEYIALRTSIEVEKNLLVVLKNSTGANTPGHVVRAEDLVALQKLEEKIVADEQRLKEIRETKPVSPARPVPVPELVLVPPAIPAHPVIAPSSPETPLPPAPSVNPVPHEHVITPVEEAIHSIEPLIEDSVPRTAPVPEPVHVPPAIPAQPVVAPSLPETPLPPAPSVNPVPHEHVITPVEEAIHSIEPLIEDSVPRTKPAPLIKRERPAPSFATSTAPEMPAPVPPPRRPVPASGPKSTKPRALMIVAVVIVIFIVVVGAFVVLKPPQGTGSNVSGSVTVTPTAKIPVVTTITATTVPTPKLTVTALEATLPLTPAQPRIPGYGVWIRITYPGTFTGTYGTPVMQVPVTNTGDRIFQIVTADGPVTASIKKQDGSADKLTITVYKEGVLVKTASTTAPEGSIDFWADLKTTTPTPTPV